MATKDVAKRVIDTLPETATMDDIICARYLNVKFDRGEHEVRRGHGIPHAQAKQQLSPWLK